MTVAREIERFLASPALSPSTRRAYRSDLRDFAEWFGADGRLERVDVRALAAYTADLGPSSGLTNAVRTGDAGRARSRPDP